MASAQMTGMPCMLIVASLTLEAAIVHLNATLILPAKDQTTDATCLAVALAVPRLVALLLPIRWRARMLAHTLTVLQATPRMMRLSPATSLGVSCPIASIWIMFPAWIAPRTAKAAS